MPVASVLGGSPKLLLQAEKLLAQPVHPHLLRCCPTMDLIAVVTTDERLDVYRFNGQRAFGLQRRAGSDAVIKSIAWKFDGHYLALGWSDGTLEVVSAAIGNAVQQFKQVNARDSKRKSNAEQPRVVSCIGWAMNFVKVEAVKHKLAGHSEAKSSNASKIPTTDDWDEESTEAEIDDFLERVPDKERTGIPVSLPDQLSAIDILAQLPKLPILPLLPPAAYSSGDHSAAELFASHVSLDAAVHSAIDRHHNELDTMLLCHDGGDVRLFLHDSLTIGDVSLSDKWRPYRITHLKHAYHPLVRSHVFVSEVRLNDGAPKLTLIPLNLKFLESAGSHLQLVQSKTAQLQLLVQYVGECLLALDHHWKHAKELPAKFTAIITEELAQQNDATFMQSLFHLACTGHCPPVLKEWLVDSLAERGHKRWDHAVSQGYTKVLELTHENLIPALDRCDMILATLKGLFEYHLGNPAYDVPLSSITLITDIIKSMRLLAHHVLLTGSREFRQFAHFSKWLRHEIDIQATDPLSSTADETLEKEIDVDVNLLLDYIKGPLEHSVLDSILCDPATAPSVVMNESCYQDVQRALRLYEREGKAEPMLDLFVISSHYKEWDRHNRELTRRITSWQRASCLMNSGLVLEEGVSKGNDIRILHEDETATYVANLPAGDVGCVHIYRLVGTLIGVDFTNPRHSIETCQLNFKGGVVRDVRFVDDHLLLILLAVDDASHLLKICYVPNPTNTEHIALQPPGFKYHPQGGALAKAKAPDGRALPLSSQQVLVIPRQRDSSLLKPLIMHTFPRTDRFKPKTIEVNGRKDRRVVFVLGEDARQLRVYDLDFGTVAGEAYDNIGDTSSSSEGD